MVFSSQELVQLLLEGWEASDLIGIFGQIEGPYALGTAEAMGWRKAFGEHQPARVMALYANHGRGDEVTRLVNTVIKGFDPVRKIVADGETRYFGLFGGVKFMVNLEDLSVSCDVGDRTFIMGLARGET